MLAGDFARAFHFDDAVLPELIGAERVQGTEAGPYAHWDACGQGVLTLFDREAMARVAGTAQLPEHGPATQDVVMFVSWVADVNADHRFCLRRGGRAVAPPADRPEWAPAFVRHTCVIWRTTSRSCRRTDGHPCAHKLRA